MSQLRKPPCKIAGVYDIMKQLRILFNCNERSKVMDTVPDGNNKKLIINKLGFAPYVNR